MNNCTDASTVKAVFRTFALFCQSLVDAGMNRDTVYNLAGETLRSYYQDNAARAIGRLTREIALLPVNTISVIGTMIPSNTPPENIEIGLQLIEGDEA